ncbi:CTP synthetase [Pseudogemmobacter humi]|uniref:CTP synthetase n=1 Tax=Pseudogemmobacter humi TaxID=2483812 RepID=A0A3P5XQD8_9RHOB|nr:CTP synthetase [Pseudogemmobacter humi]VDC33090.1 hypothetical protein XINFAN_03632 [Pseudogemmobacter humi]
MTRLFLLLLSITLPTLAGVGVVVALASGQVAVQPIVLGAAIGAVLALPVAWMIARQLSS